MATDFSAQQLRNVILDDAVQNMASGQQRFEDRRSSPEVMKMFFRQRDNTLSPNEIAALENTRPGQSVELNVWDQRQPGTGSAYVRQGAGSRSVSRVIPQLFDPVEEGVDMSLINNAIRQYGSEGADKREIVRRAYTDKLSKELPNVFRNVYTRLNAQYTAYLESIKWVLTNTPDAGGQYTDFSGDAKNIPDTEDKLQIFKKIQVEAEKNNFLMLGMPEVLGSPELRLTLQEYFARGANNETNQEQFLGYFDPFFDNEIPNENQFTAYLVAAGGVFGYQNTMDWGSHPEAQNGQVLMGNDGWRNITIGGQDTLMFEGLPELDLSVKTYGGWADNSATYAVPEATIDIVNNWSFVAQCGGGHAYNSNPDISPVIKYVYE